MNHREMIAEAETLAPWMREKRRLLHTIPEIGSDLPRTRDAIRNALMETGLEARETAGSLTLLLGNPEKGRTVLLRADMDALPMEEGSGLPFAAVNGNCHACGHDLHSAMLLGAARLLQRREKELPGAVRVLFQCAEETAEGAGAFLKTEDFQCPRPDVAFALHVQPEMKGGTIKGGPGYRMRSYDAFRAEFTGRAGHGATPWRAASPLPAASIACLRISTLAAGRCAPEEEAVISVGQMHGGSAANLIPEAAFLEGTLRAGTQEARDSLRTGIREIVAACGEGEGVKTNLRWLSETPPLYNDPELTRRVIRLLQEVGLQAGLEEKSLPFSEDFAVIAREIPTVYLNLGAGMAGEPVRFNHDPAVRYDENVLPVGCAALALMAWTYLEENA